MRIKKEFSQKYIKESKGKKEKEKEKKPGVRLFNSSIYPF